ncbi:MAG: Hsp70 family protein [Defluviitaleaceae bacterium]|nr:Hsp70 family protein [Defluviitaleaceae bacterium]
MPVSIGIDLGTTFSAVAWVNPRTGKPEIVPNTQDKKITPSVIQFINGQPVFGDEAASAYAAGDTGCVGVFKRRMGKNETYATIDGKAYTPKDLSALLLGHLKAEAEAVLGDTIQDAVITVPAYFLSDEREDTLNAAESVGLKVKKLIDEPNAASLAYGINHWRENANILVYDLGGGTFDVTLVRMVKGGNIITVVTEGNQTLGGKDWDAQLTTLLLKKVKEETLLEETPEILTKIKGISEDIKRRLTTTAHVKTSTNIPGYGNVELTITQEEFESATAGLLDRTGALCQAVLDGAGIDKTHITDILLVGGSTRMPQVSTYLTALFGKKPITHVHPDEAVALGAAIQATKEEDKYADLSISMVDGKKVTKRDTSLTAKHKVKDATKLASSDLIMIRESTAHAMGMIAVNADAASYINDVIIPANHARPTRAAKAFTFYTSPSEDRIMDIYVLQGEKERPLDNTIYARYIISGLRHNNDTRGKTTIRVQYSYDKNGIIQVSARQEKDMHDLPIRKEPVPGDMSQFDQPPPQQSSAAEQLSVVLAVDVSGSMSGQPLDDSKRAMEAFVKQMDFSHTHMGIVVVSDSTAVVCDLTDNANKCIKAINSITCGQTGYGNAAHPFDTLKKMLQKVGGQRVAIILADGEWYGKDIAIRASKSCNHAGIETAGIGFGDADHGFIRDISSNEANALLVPQSHLTQAFGSIAQSISGGKGDKKDISGGTDIATWDN